MFQTFLSYFSWHPLYKKGLADGQKNLIEIVKTNMQQSHESGRDEGIRIGQEMQKKEEEKGLKFVLHLDQALETTVTLGEKEEEHLRILTNSSEYQTLRKYLLQLSLEYFERSSQAKTEDCYVISRMGNFIRQLVLHLDQRRKIQQGSLPDSFTP